ncbi:hypothetical protein [Homoserinimonas sp. OAct 916]|uniref:hypothetical protein n=1 Tax=Homoserinimonas sp. OAct 916 TaxID=2211450 RepID=UPI0013006DEB|nr:hypothetical protein [Homoserinimonas sp. OAct 916]
MTRGRQINRLHVVAESIVGARAQFVEAMERDPADRGLDHATHAAREAVRGIIKDGPMQRVGEVLARLDQEAQRAEWQAERWEQTANRFDVQRAMHRAQDDETTAVLRHAEEEAARVRAEVATPLAAEAEREGAAYLATVEAETTANARLATVGQFGKRKARDAHRTATEQAQAARSHLRQAWEAEPPRTPESLPAWVGQISAQWAENEPRVSDANQIVETARAKRAAT